MKSPKRVTEWCLVLAVVFLLATNTPASASTILALWDYNGSTYNGTFVADNGNTPKPTPAGPQNPFADAGILAGTAQQVWYSGADLGAWGYNDGNQPRRGTSPNYTYPGDWSVDTVSGTADMRYRFVMNATNEGLRWNVSTAGYEDIQIQLGVFTGTNWTTTSEILFV